MKRTEIEVVQPPAGGYRCALFDFDGTISLIRAGWQNVMIPYFCDALTPFARGESAEAIRAEVREFVDRLTGKQTIWQCMALADSIRRRGGEPEAPGVYKAEYLRRLAIRIADKKEALRSGTTPPEALSVKGSIVFLRALRAAGLRCFLASGTDEADVKEEAALLGVADLFDGGIFGAREALTDCSKEAVIRGLIQSERLSPAALLGFGDGFVEIELVSGIGGCAVGVTADEVNGGTDKEKYERLKKAGAQVLIRDFGETDRLLELLKIK